MISDTPPIELHNNSDKESRKIILSEDLFEGRREVVIRHEGNFYRLMITKAGKLILNK